MEKEKTRKVPKGTILMTEFHEEIAGQHLPEVSNVGTIWVDYAGVQIYCRVKRHNDNQFEVIE